MSLAHAQITFRDEAVVGNRPRVRVNHLGAFNMALKPGDEGVMSGRSKKTAGTGGFSQDCGANRVVLSRTRELGFCVAFLDRRDDRFIDSLSRTGVVSFEQGKECLRPA